MYRIERKPYKLTRYDVFLIVWGALFFLLQGPIGSFIVLVLFFVTLGIGGILAILLSYIVIPTFPVLLLARVIWASLGLTSFWSATGKATKVFVVGSLTLIALAIPPIIVNAHILGQVNALTAGDMPPPPGWEPQAGGGQTVILRASANPDCFKECKDLLDSAGVGRVIMADVRLRDDGTLRTDSLGNMVYAIYDRGRPIERVRRPWQRLPAGEVFAMADGVLIEERFLPEVGLFGLSPRRKKGWNLFVCRLYAQRFTYYERRGETFIPVYRTTHVKGHRLRALALTVVGQGGVPGMPSTIARHWRTDFTAGGPAHEGPAQALAPLFSR
ncbi:MAG TPA: hypothetical protein DDX54_03155 [Rhodospirillaceae bacterium]|mgnify:CR=1 FL=1|jgi:hypothetical protein|nr:hypothetical protein [Alphaproteobacteria bacterium]HBH26382.1 hypothetical protein [Rhodospirillaceae bacterium]